MKKLSVSFTIGKASAPNKINLKHNKREFVAKNVDVRKVDANVEYIVEDVEEAYKKLFDEAVAEYNQKVSRPCRQIKDYFKHISEGKREEPFYEAIVQFGDVDTAACGSESGKMCKIMLEEFMNDFIKHNPNLHVFYATLHLDEATPHLHIDFIPFYTKGRKNGLSKGVSMKAALIEQGFVPKNPKVNQLVAWEESERSVMEKILNRHGIEREDKNAHYEHMTVNEYKDMKHYQDEVKQTIKNIKSIATVSAEETNAENIIRLKDKISSLEFENTNLKKEKDSPYVAFFYSSPEKQEFVMDEIRRRKIPIRETENGFEAKEIYKPVIREIENSFKSVGGNKRDVLRNDIDRILMQSDSFEDFLKKLQALGYEIKKGKYIAARPLQAQNFIRFKSLGEHYSEQALRNRFTNKQKFESDIDQKITEGEQKKIDVTVLRVMRFYTVSFKKGELPCRRIHKNKPFSWKNDEVLDRLTRLNNLINEGVTLETMRYDFAEAEKKCNEVENSIKTSRKDLNFFLELKEQAELLFEGKRSEKFSLNQARETFAQHRNINKNNYNKLDELIQTEKENIQNYENDLAAEKEKLKETSDTLALAEKVFGGTYIQSLVNDERYRTASDFIPNGFWNA